MAVKKVQSVPYEKLPVKWLILTGWKRYKSLNPVPWKTKIDYEQIKKFNSTETDRESTKGI